MIVALILYGVILGVIYMLSDDPEKVMLPTPIVVLAFALSLIFTTMFFVERGAVYPWSLLGGGIAALAITFIVTAIYGGLQYIMGRGFAGLGWEISLYLLAACVITSVILITYTEQKL
jgi:hypothetical protein